jgi:DNA-binding transcriptional LysR family regulator
MLDLRRLRVLREVGRRGSFSAAADALGYTQPAVSRQIAVLEAELGCTLIRRTPQGAVLTDAARLLADRAGEILADLERLEGEVRARAGLEGGSLRLAAFPSAAASIVPPAIARFRERHPAVELSLVIADPVTSIPMLRGGELDLALSHDTPDDAECAARYAGLELIHLFDDPMYVAMPLDHPLVDTEPLDIASFATDAWMLTTIDNCPDSRRFIRACNAAGFEPRIAFENDDYPALLGFVAAGVGVALIPELVSRGVREDVVVRGLDPTPALRPIHVALPSGYRSPAAAAMIAILHEVSEEWAAGRGALRAAPAG